MSEYFSINYKTSHFHIDNMKQLLSSSFDSNLDAFALQSHLSATKLEPVKTSLSQQSTYLFDKMSCQSNQIETVKYVYLACVDSNHTFVDSTDTELEISDPTLSNTFFQNLTDGKQYITKNNETYLHFQFNQQQFIGILFPIGHHFSCLVVVETFSDDSIAITSTDITLTELNYGFDILDENEVLLNHVQNPNDNFFEYAS